MISKYLRVASLLLQVQIWQAKNMYLHSDLKPRYSIWEGHRSWIQSKRDSAVWAR